MPKQSPKNPRFRCNECKEFYHASDDDYNVHYQCPVHGYLCGYHTIDEECCINDDDFEECGKKTIKYIWHEDEGRWIEKEKRIEKEKPKEISETKTLIINYEKPSREGIGDGYGGLTVDYKPGLDICEVVGDGNFLICEKERTEPAIQLIQMKGWFGKISYILEFFDKNGNYEEEKEGIESKEDAIEYIYDSPIPKKWGWNIAKSGSKQTTITDTESLAPLSEEVDIEKELEKLKGLLDKGLITQEDYDAKKKELLGL